MYRWFMNQSMRNKLLMVFMVLSAALASIGVLGVWGVGKLHAMLDSVINRDMKGNVAIVQAGKDIATSWRAAEQAVYEPDRQRARENANEALAALKETEAHLDACERTLVSESGKQHMREIRAGLPGYRAAVQATAQAALDGDHARGVVALGELQMGADELKEHFASIEGSKLRLMDATETSANALFRRLTFTVLGATLAMIALGWLYGLWLAGLLSRPLGRAVAVLERVADGDLTSRLEVESERDEVGRLAKALNTATEGVRRAMTEVRNTSQSVTIAADELAHGSQSISSGAQHQASSLEETAASLEELTSTVKQNADSAQQANQLAAGSRDIAERGGTVVHSAIVAMTEINSSSKKIADIITTIDEIAFQTNLLALNAAVEAARAGEQGRGFAVVAGEVRNLAQRSASAAKEIKSLIQDSVRKVEDGSALVSDSGRTLDEIVGSVKRVTDIVGEIAAASKEQSIGIDQVTTAVSAMDHVTQSNASQTEELNATAENLAAQARELQKLVSHFRIDAGSPMAAPPIHAPRAAARPKLRMLAKSGSKSSPALAVAATGTDGGFEEF